MNGNQAAFVSLLGALVLAFGLAQANVLGPYGQPGDVYHLLILALVLFMTFLWLFFVVRKHGAEPVA